MAQIHAFISYQHFDLHLAQELATALKHCKSPTFIDEHTGIGDLWDTKLKQAISSAFAVIPTGTPSSVQSRWVRLESRYAFRMGILFPVLRQPCVPPPKLSDVEFAHLTDWEPDNTQHVEWNNLINSLRCLPIGNNQTRPRSEADLCFRLGMRFLEGLQAPQNDTMAFTGSQKLRTSEILERPQPSSLLNCPDPTTFSS